MKIKYAARVETGRKETNDDRVLIGGHIVKDGAAKGDSVLPAIAVVCDGCGGYHGGWLAAETILENLADKSPESLGREESLKRALEECNQKILEEKAGHPEFTQMCSTVAGCIFLEDSILLFHSGDSRIYRFDQWDLVRMTKDHSVVQGKVDLGELTEEEACMDPDRNIITRCMGVPCPLPEIRVVKSPIAPGDKYLLCSDGLWESVLSEQISEILSRDVEPEIMADLLLQKALAQGSEDNISVCVCAAPESEKKSKASQLVLD